MIPYDDLVAALSAWRARQGLPVSTLGGSSSGPTAQPGSGPNVAMASPGSGPYGTPGSGPNRGAPPPPQSGRTKAPSMPPPMGGQTQDEALEVGDESMLEEHYENEGDDFAMSFNPNAGGAGGDGDDATSIGAAPERPTEADMNRRNDRDDW